MEKKSKKDEKKEKKQKLVLLFLAILLLISSIVSTAYVSIKTTEVIRRKAVAVGKAVGKVELCFDVELPELDPIGNLTAYVGKPFSFKVNATSPVNKTVYYSDNASFFDIDELTGWINFTPTSNDVGSYAIKISASHRICDTEVFEVVNFTIYANNPPVWNESKAYSFNLTEDQNFFLNISDYVTDYDNDTITFYASPSSFPSFNITADGIMNFTPSDVDVGFHSFNITANDSFWLVPHCFNFSVSNVNDPPYLEPIESPLYACEDSLFYYDVNASDDDLLIPNTPEKLYFYNYPKTLFVINEDTGEIIFTPDYDVVGNHTIRIYVTDEEAYDDQDVNFIVIPVNDKPELEPIGAKIVRVNETLSFIARAVDEEDGSNEDGNLRFNISFANNVTLFDINETTGAVNYTANESDIGTYNVTICVTDRGIEKPANASLCNNDYLPKSDCETFSVTVLEANNPPEITSYYPTELEITIEETQSINFNVTAYDPDNTTLTIYWYVNEELENHSFGNTANFTFSTSYGDAGNYLVEAVASDGEANDSIEWNVTVLPKPRPKPSVGGGGGGICKEKWKCTSWSECQNISLFREKLSKEEYEEWKSKCYELMKRAKIAFWQCGIQLRICEDVSKCGTIKNRPSLVKACVLVPPPSCHDGIRNCHHGACEILVDCGGPCKPCPIKIKKPKIEFPKIERAKPKTVCGDKVCNLNETFSCIKDCYVFLILWIVAILLLVTSIIEIKRRSRR